MAKNLQSVLNSVVNDLLQEEMTVTPEDKALAARIANGGAVDREGLRAINTGVAGWAPSPENHQKAVTYGKLIASGMDRATAAEKAGLGGESQLAADLYGYNGRDPQRAASADIQTNAVLAQQNVPFSDRMYSTYLDAKNQIGNFADEHPGMFYGGLGALGASALAAGAGALYLRKKQREANKAAGR